MPTREAADTQRDDSDQVLQAVKFTDKKAPGLHLDLDDDLQAVGCFTEAIRGSQMEQWNQMSCAAFSQQEQPESRLTSSSLSQRPDAWKLETDCDLCPLDWPSTKACYGSVPKDLHQFVDQLNQQMNHSHMFSPWEINHDKLTSRVLYQLPAHYLSEATCCRKQTRDFPADESAKGHLRPT